MPSFAKILLFNYLLIHVICSEPVDVEVADTGLTLKILWHSTGLCPPDPHEGFKDFATSDGFRQNLRLIGSLPYEYGKMQVRIHWLLDLVTLGQNTTSYDFKNLDYLVNLVNETGLGLGFELMGNPNNTFHDFENKSQVYGWYKLVSETVSRYSHFNHLKLWNFESWNEPENADFDGLNFTKQGFLNYVDATEKGVHDADDKARFGAPASSCKIPGVCWDIIDHVFDGINYFTGKKGTRLDYFSFHKKGGNRGKPGYTTDLIDGEIKVLSYLSNRYPHHFTNLTIYNDEGDPVIGWDEPMEFYTGSMYPAMVVKVIHRHLYSNNTLFENYHMTSNDNAFLGYRPHYFTQRTLFARFQINDTDRPYTVLIRKPIYDAMAMLAPVKGKLLNNTVYRNGHIGLVSTLSVYQLCLTFFASNDTNTYNADAKYYQIQLPRKFANARYIIRVLNNLTHNTYDTWLALGKPDNLTLKQIETLWNVTMVIVTHQGAADKTLNVPVLGPGITQVILCTKAEILNMPYQLRIYKVTENAVLITWKDEQISECFLSYILEIRRPGSMEYAQINNGILLTRAYQFASSLGVQGHYRVRSADILGQFSAYSEITAYHEH